MSRVQVSERLARVDGRAIYTRYLDMRATPISVTERELPPGPWHDEPDHVDFEHAGHPCILHRGPTGAWCGYVAVAPGHAWHGRGYEWDGGVDADVHGGITYAQKCLGPICHVAKPGEPDDAWWVGFDCNHHLDMDFQSVIEHDGGSYLDSPYHGWIARYRDVEYVRAETMRLAEQARTARVEHIGGDWSPAQTARPA